MNNSRKALLFVGFAAVAAWAFAQGSRLGAVDQHVSQLNKAQSLKVTLNARAVDGSSERTYTVTLSKPNMVSVDGPNTTTVADGKQITVFNKGEKTFYKMPQTAEELTRVFGTQDLQLVVPFFEAQAWKGAKVKSTTSKRRKGEDMTAVELSVDPTGKQTATFFVDKNGLARQLEFSDGTNRTLVDADGLTISAAPAADSAFAFKAPEGARELSYEEMFAAKWYTDMEEAKKVAAATGKLILIDFYTDWCHWCKVLDEKVFPTEKFKEQSKHFVFVKIDAEKREDISGPFKITGYPTAIITKADGTTEVHRIVGFKEVDAYVADMSKAVGR